MTKKKSPDQLKKRGPKPKPIDYALVGRLAQRQGSYREIAACLGIDEANLRRRAEKDPKLAAVINAGQEMGKMTLRTRMWNSAMEGVPSIQIFLAKNYLGMADESRTKISGHIDHKGAYDLSKLTTEQLDEFLRLMAIATAAKTDGGENQAA